MNKDNGHKPSRTDWERVHNREDEDIDFSDSPELDEEFFAMPSGTSQRLGRIPFAFFAPILKPAKKSP